ncbi:glycerophosphodiester phosphodiesterase [Bacillus cereus]|nr:glycerophosphodiester phosphodiesterase [Bacillus cereus]
MKKPFYKKWWFWLIVVIVVIGAAGNSSKDKEEAKETSTESKQEAKQETKKDEPKKEEPKKEEPKKELSKEGESSKVKIAVGSVESIDSVGGEYLKEKAQGVFKVVEITITNNQKDAITIDANSFKLVDNQDREFKYSTQAQTAFDIGNGGGSDFFLKQLNPGLSQTGKIIFDVPTDAQGLVLKARGGMMGKEIKLKVE